MLIQDLIKQERNIFIKSTQHFKVDEKSTSAVYASVSVTRYLYFSTTSSAWPVIEIQTGGRVKVFLQKSMIVSFVLDALAYRKEGLHDTVKSVTAGPYSQSSSWSRERCAVSFICIKNK